MTGAPEEPRDYSDVSEESPREACGNLAMTIGSEAAFYDVNGIRSQRGRLATIPVSDLIAWASRLERAVEKLDAEKNRPLYEFKGTVAAHLGADVRNTNLNVVRASAAPAGEP